MNSVQSSVTSDQLEGKRLLPEGWAWTTIGEVADTTSGGTPSRKNPEYFQGVIPWVKSGELGDGFISKTEEKITDDALRNSSAKLFSSDTVLVALYGATVGKVGILKIDAASNQAVCALFPRNNSFTAKYMFYWLMSQRQELINKSMGGAQPNISQGIVRSHPFPLSPLPEQERIVARLEELLSDLEAGVAALRRVRAGVKRYKASVLKTIFEKRPEKEWQRLGDVTRVLRGASPRPKGNPKYYGGTIPWIKISDVTKEKGKYLTTTVDTVTPEGVKKSRFLSEGSLILSICATVCVPKILRIDGCIHDGFVYFPDLLKDVDTSYLYYFFESIRSKVIQENRQGMTQVNLNTGIVSNFQVPLPSLEEQRQIVAEVERRLESARAVESAVEAGLKRAGRLRQAVLRSAFEGKLA